MEKISIAYIHLDRGVFEASMALICLQLRAQGTACFGRSDTGTQYIFAGSKGVPQHDPFIFQSA